MTKPKYFCKLCLADRVNAGILDNANAKEVEAGNTRQTVRTSGMIELECAWLSHIFNKLFNIITFN